MRLNTGLILTGTRGSGKSTIAYAIAQEVSDSVIVPAVTTRAKRRDDRPGAYRYFSPEEFAVLVTNEKLLVKSRYGAAAYGIVAADVAQSIECGALPILTITPEATHELVAKDASIHWLGLFLDASDDLLDSRLVGDGRPPSGDDWAQRREDRSWAQPPLVCLMNTGSLTEAVQAVLAIINDH
ncbi:MAG: hypothetical protein DLM61_22470 [Pseudonocardiales bacterium]|nr:MAG: hypothetical protein DLM61_22470 [Pseudonocardiales bacterium]